MAVEEGFFLALPPSKLKLSSRLSRLAIFSPRSTHSKCFQEDIHSFVKGKVDALLSSSVQCIFPDFDHEWLKNRCQCFAKFLTIKINCLCETMQFVCIKAISAFLFDRKKGERPFRHYANCISDVIQIHVTEKVCYFSDSIIFGFSSFQSTLFENHFAHRRFSQSCWAGGV